MADFSTTTRKNLHFLLVEKGLDCLVQDSGINPGADDEVHLEAVRGLAADPNVDAMVVGRDPLSPAMRTLALYVEGRLRAERIRGKKSAKGSSG